MKTVWNLRYHLFVCLLAVGLMPNSASAGHLFTQASANTPINLTTGNGIRITQLTFEGIVTNGNVSLNFNGDWGAGDAVKITIGSWVQTFTYSSPLSGTTQTASALVVADPTLAAAGIQKSAGMQWTVIAAAGDFTFTGYRIYITDGTFNGTGADAITQDQVVTENELNGGSFASVATSPTKGLAATLDTLNGSTTDQQMANVITALSNMSESEQAAAIKQMAPETSQAIGQAAMNTAVAALDTVQVRLDTLRTGVGVVAGNREHYEPSDTEGLSSGDETLSRHMWMKAFGGAANLDAKDGFAGSDDRIYGTMIGYDNTTPEGWLLGAALGYARTDVDMTDYRVGDSADIDTFQLTGYFGRSYAKLYVQGMLTYARQDYTTFRDPHMGTGVARGDFKGDLYALRLVAGMPIEMREGGMTVTPYAGVEASHTKQYSYTESGAGALSMNVDASTTDRVRSIFGVEVAAMKKFDDGSVLRPSVKFNWRHEFRDDGANTVTSLVGGGSHFETIGQAVNRNVYGVMGRLNWEKTETTNIAVELGAEGGSGYSSISAQIMGGQRF